MNIVNVKCPNCGGNLTIYPGMKQTYCKFCSSLLVIGNNEGQRTEIQSTRGNSDNPLSVEVIKVASNPVRLFYNCSSDPVYQVFFGISYILKSPIPFQHGDIVTVEKYQAKKTLFGGKGRWKYIGESPHVCSSEIIERPGISYKKTQCEPVEEERYTPRDELYDKTIQHITKIEAKVLPDGINNYPEVRHIIDKSKENPYIQNMLSAIIRDIPDSTSVNSMGVVAKSDGLTLEINICAFSQEYKFHAFSLDDCASRYHRTAILAIASAEILTRLGDQFSIHEIDSREDEDHPMRPLEHLGVYFRPLKIEKKNYQSW